MLLPIALLLCSAPSAPSVQGTAPSAEESVASRLDRVTVYDGMALVERVLTVHAEAPGSRVLILTGLPASLEDSSLQTRVESGSAVVQSVSVSLTSGDPLAAETRKELRAALDEKQNAWQELEAEEASIRSGNEVLEALIASLRGDSARPVVLDAASSGSSLDAMFDFVRKRSADLQRERSRLETRRASLKAEMDDLRRRLGVDGDRPLRSKKGRIRLAFDRPGEVRLRASYLVSGASWKPAYDVRVSPDLTGVDVGFVAELRQRTGEEWKDAEILLSTSTPSVGLDPPTVPLRIFALEAPGGVRPRPATAPVLENALSRDRESRSLDAAASVPEVEVHDLGISAQFQLPERKTVPNDGSLRRFRIRQVPLAVNPERYVVPTRSDKAYLRAQVTLSGDAPLLPGSAKIFLGPDYLGEELFPLLRPGDSTVLGLGIDPNLTVTWEKIDDERDDPGLLSSTVSIQRTFRASLKLSAAAKGPVDVVVEESIPVSRAKSVSVSPRGIRPAPLRGVQDLRDQKERGLFRWRLGLKPGEGQNVYWGYELEFDEDHEPFYQEQD